MAGSSSSKSYESRGFELLRNIRILSLPSESLSFESCLGIVGEDQPHGQNDESLGSMLTCAVDCASLGVPSDHAVTRMDKARRSLVKQKGTLEFSRHPRSYTLLHEPLQEIKPALD